MGSRGWFWVLFGVICFCLYVWGLFFFFVPTENIKKSKSNII